MVTTLDLLVIGVAFLAPWTLPWILAWMIVVKLFLFILGTWTNAYVKRQPEELKASYNKHYDY